MPKPANLQAAQQPTGIKTRQRGNCFSMERWLAQTSEEEPFTVITINQSLKSTSSSISDANTKQHTNTSDNGSLQVDIAAMMRRINSEEIQRQTTD
jgi:hypothetical protein